MGTIGKENRDRIEQFVIAMVEHGYDNIQETAMLSVPKSVISMYDGALKEVEDLVQDILKRYKK